MSDFQFVLGFKTLADMLGPDVIGEPLEDEHFNPECGDTLQLTTKGLMVWRKAENICAFTNGDRTWLNGPEGLQERGNNERFDWEREIQLPSPIIEKWNSPNCWVGRPYGPPIAIVIHTMAGYEAGMESVAMNPLTQVSAHFGVNMDGDIDAMVDLSDRAWHAGVTEEGTRWFDVYKGRVDGFTENPNNHTVGVETEDFGKAETPVTDEMFDNTLVVCREAIKTYPSIEWLLRHADIAPLSRARCPGPRWVESGRFANLAEALGLKTLL
jgi:hypothetical protein